MENNNNNNNVIPITRPSVKQVDNNVGDIPSQFIEKTVYPTETIDLVSKGWFYPEGHPLSSGQIELKIMTAREEDILTSQNLIKKGIVLQKWLDSLIIDKRIKQDDILLCDINGIYVAARRMAYGDEYNIKTKCPSCGNEQEVNVDLSKIESKPFDFEKYPKGQNLFSFVLPFSKKEITYKMLTQQEDESVDGEIKQLSKLNKEKSTEVTTRLKHVIQSVNGDDDKANIRKFIENELLAKDTLAFRRYIRENTPDLDMSFPFVCSNCEFNEKIDVPISIGFFWPDSQR